jgi:GAF domain-containing protein
MARDAEHGRLLRGMAARSYLCAPLVANDRLLGTLTLTASQPHRYYPETVALAEELARRPALALDNARLYESERIARAEAARMFERAQAEISERTRTEKELRASRDQLEAILGGIADGAAVQDASGRCVYANDAAARLAGFDSASEYINAAAADIRARRPWTRRAC